jgi:hypothetical protein
MKEPRRTTTASPVTVVTVPVGESADAGSTAERKRKKAAAVLFIGSSFLSGRIITQPAFFWATDRFLVIIIFGDNLLPREGQTMRGIVKVAIIVAVVVFLMQLILNGVSNLLNSNTSVQGAWRTSAPTEQDAQFHEIPTSDLWVFVPRSVSRVVVDAIDALVRLYEDGRRAILRAWPV